MNNETETDNFCQYCKIEELERIILNQAAEIIQLKDANHILVQISATNSYQKKMNDDGWDLKYKLPPDNVEKPSKLPFPIPKNIE